MTKAPDSRKTHVTRIFGTNKKDEVLHDLSADVERMDVIKSAMQIPPDRQWQGVQRSLKWSDDPTKADYAPDGTPSRLIEILKVCDPESTADVNDPEEWIPIPVIKGMKSKGGGGEGMGDGFMDRFLNAVFNEELQTERVVETRRINHYDTNIDGDIQAAVDADPTLKQYVVPGDQYTRDESTKDTSQYVEHEIATYLKHKGNTLAVDAMGRQTKLLNTYLIDESEPAKLEVTGNNGINPPYRLDPFQNIVNVKFRATNNLMFIWKSGWTSGVPEDNRSGYYQGLVGGDDVGSGSFDKDLARPHGFTPGDSTSKLNAKQQDTADSLGGAVKIDGSLAFVYVSADNTLYAIDRKGEISQTVDLTTYTNVVPPGFNPTGQVEQGQSDGSVATVPPEPNPPNGSVSSFEVASDKAVFAFSFSGITPQFPGTITGGPADGLPAGVHASMTAVGYLVVGKDGVTAYEIIEGPNEGTGATDIDTTVYNFEEADSPSLYLISKNNNDPV